MGYFLVDLCCFTKLIIYVRVLLFYLGLVVTYVLVDLNCYTSIWVFFSRFVLFHKIDNLCKSIALLFRFGSYICFSRFKLLYSIWVFFSRFMLFHKPIICVKVLVILFRFGNYNMF